MSTGPDGRESVSINAACELLGVSRRTLYNWMAAAKVEYYYTAGGSRRIYKETLFRRTTNAKEESVRDLRANDFLKQDT